MNTVLCVKWGDKFSPEYVNKLYSMVGRNLTLDHRFVCLTDDPVGLVDGVDVLPFPEAEFKYFWNKLYLFDTGLEGTGLYFDLDVVITSNIDELFLYEPEKPFIGLRDWNRPYTLNTSVMRWELGKYGYVLDRLREGLREGWLTERSEIERNGGERITYLDSRTEVQWFVESMGNPRWKKENWIDGKVRFAGDQEWTTYNVIGQDNLDRETFPKEWLLSYRKHKQPTTRTKAMIFHGDPKPHEAVDTFVKENWK